MDSVLRQSKAVCPFMRQATAAGLRAMSTAVTPATPAASPCGGAISKLQVLARRCPVMGKAMAIQSARLGHATAGFPAVPAKATMSTFSGHGKIAKASLHTSRSQEAQAVDGSLFTGRDKGQSYKPDSRVQ
jgi:5-aminolevulinate synthase